ncbi:hypothetical protein DVS28_b0200 (plasmid) [Euzebya pacifica]|uniref:Uncharacterized protein n=1 Tax=Euzebya pacifica TaxID=1608957 RepID=A0A346Y673_9ACTN|nr:hypothetical protein [Euzebya pacifica]AXV09970.1 hypothetical protein DVS28_b0200 [Euzebya pacifica]
MTTFYANITAPDGTPVFTEESGWKSDAAEVHGWVMRHPARTHVSNLTHRLEVTGSEIAKALDGWHHLDPDASYTIEVDEY